MIQIQTLVAPSAAQMRMVFTGMRNPYNSWAKSDSWTGSEDCPANDHFILGENDLRLARNLIERGPEHRKFLRQLPVMMEVKAPLYWWKQMDQYKLGTVTDSCSTMHTLAKEPFTMEDFSFEADVDMDKYRRVTVDSLNTVRHSWLDTGNIEYWRLINEMLPQSYNQLRTWSGNYETLRTICHQREGHKLPEWADFIEYVRDNVPLAKELIF